MSPGALAVPPPLDLSRCALFADLDGTLTPIRPRPDDVGPDTARTELIHRLSEALGGALAVVSGRALADIDRIFAGSVTAVAAVHGLVRRRADGRVIADVAEPIPAAARRALLAFAAARRGVAAEDKAVAIALHYRAEPSAGPAAHALVERLAAQSGLLVQVGDEVVELRAPGPDKGGSVSAFMAEPPFAGRTPVFIGDDFTDENGFCAAERLGGYGLIVGARRPTLAAFALPDPAAALAWLATSAQAAPRG